MTLPVHSEAQSFVLLHLGERRFALAATQIAELVAPSRVFRFPHRTQEVEGVILRRGRILPVCDVAENLISKRLSSRRFYLIAQRRYGCVPEWIALPVSGDCELVTTEMWPASAGDSAHVAGWLSHGGDVIEVLNLAALTPGPSPSEGSATADRQEARV